MPCRFVRLTCSSDWASRHRCSGRDTTECSSLSSRCPKSCSSCAMWIRCAATSAASTPTSTVRPARSPPCRPGARPRLADPPSTRSFAGHFTLTACRLAWCQRLSVGRISAEAAWGVICTATIMTAPLPAQCRKNRVIYSIACSAWSRSMPAAMTVGSGSSVVCSTRSWTSTGFTPA